MLEQEAALLTQVLARGARNDPFLVLVTLGRARRERSSVEADCYWPLGMVQCLGRGGAGLAGTPCAAGGTSRICSWMLLLQIQGFGRAPRTGGEGSVELGEDEDAQAQAAQQSSSPCCEPGWPQSRGWQGQGQTVALIRGWAGAGDIPGQERLQLCSFSARARRPHGWEQELQTFTAFFPFFFLLWMGINPWTCSQGTQPDTASGSPSSEQEVAPKTPRSESGRKSN